MCLYLCLCACVRARGRARTGCRNQWRGPCWSHLCRSKLQCCAPTAHVLGKRRLQHKLCEACWDYHPKSRARRSSEDASRCCCTPRYVNTLRYAQQHVMCCWGCRHKPANLPSSACCWQLGEGSCYRLLAGRLTASPLATKHPPRHAHKTCVARPGGLRKLAVHAHADTECVDHHHSRSHGA